MNTVFKLRPALLIWMMMIVKAMTEIVGLEYAILLLGILFSICFISRKGIKLNTFKILSPLLILFVVQCAGFLGNPSMHALKNIIAVIGIWGISYCLLSKEKEKFSIWYRLCFILLIIFYFYQYMRSGEEFFALQNSLAACLTFLYFDYLILEFLNESEKKSKMRILFFAVCCIALLLLVFITNSRTALFTFILILLVYVLLSLMRFKEKTLNKLYWLLVFTLVLIIYIYTNIHNFSWYNEVNQYSIEFFGKNLDSSRPFLWSSELSRLKGRLFVGLGTGILPQLERYADSSFHNTYIQLLMQNGVIGLICLILYLYNLWKKITSYIDTRLGKLLLAVLVGVLIYNCFEVTLLSNKIFVGIAQWYGLILGIRILQCSEINQETNYINKKSNEIIEGIL